MGAVSFASDQRLQERIFQMQKQSPATGVGQVLEEANQLCGEGRYIEASALVEKAEAMLAATTATAGHLGPVPPHREEESRPEAASLEEQFAQILTNVTSGIAKVLVSAIQDLQRHMTGETKRLSAAFDQRLDKFQVTVESLQPLSARIDSLAEAGVAVQQNYERLAATTASLQEADARRSEEIGTLRLQVQEASAVATTQIEEIYRRIEGQERDINSANARTSELVSRMTAAADRLAQHTSAIRALHHLTQQRTATLDQVGAALSQLRAVQTDVDAALATL